MDFPVPTQDLRGGKYRKTNYENIYKDKKKGLEIKLEILKIKKSHQDHHLFQLRLLENGSFMPPTIQVSFAISDEIL